MAELVVIGYSNVAEAQEVMRVLQGLERDLVIQTAGTAVVVRDDDGALRSGTGSHEMRAGTAPGRLWDAIMGTLLVADRPARAGLLEEFRAQVAALVRPGSAAVAALFRDGTCERTVDALAPYGGTVLRTSLSAEAERRLIEGPSASSSLAALA